MSSFERLLELVNNYLERKGTSLGANEVTFGTPVKLVPAVAQAYDRNTKVEAISTSDPDDRTYFYYDRLELPILFGGEEVPVNVNFYTAEDAIAALNSKYNLNIALESLKSFEMIGGYRARIVIGNDFLYLEDSELIIYPETDLTYIENFAERYHQYVHFTLPETLRGMEDET